MFGIKKARQSKPSVAEAGCGGQVEFVTKLCVPGNQTNSNTANSSTTQTDETKSVCALANDSPASFYRAVDATEMDKSQQ